MDFDRLPTTDEADSAADKAIGDLAALVAEADAREDVMNQEIRNVPPLRRFCVQKKNSDEHFGFFGHNMFIDGPFVVFEQYNLDGPSDFTFLKHDDIIQIVTNCTANSD